MKWIILLVIFIIILLVVTLIFVKSNKKDKNEVQNNIGNSGKNEIDTKNNMKNEKDTINENTYFTIKLCINSYYDSIYSLSHTVNSSVPINDEYKEYQANVILNMLNNQFVKRYNLKTNSVIKIYDNYQYKEFLIEKIYPIENKNDISTYAVYGKQIDIINEEAQDYGIIIMMDETNKTFSILPYEYMKELGYEQFNEDLEQSELEIPEKIDIAENNTNLFTKANIDKENLVGQIFNEYSRFVKYDSEYAYNLLDKDYREKRFANKEEGIEYLKNTFQGVFGYKLTKMVVNDDNKEYMEYLCQDSNENYFIIRKDKQYMKYSILLDAYTVPINQFVLKYRNGNNARKTALNLEKFKQMINLKDYKSAYSVLNETFRENNFGSVEKFEEYVKQNWPEYITINYNNYKEAGEVGTLEGYIAERGVSEEELAHVINKTFIVKLIDDEKFEMSFNVE